MNFRILGRISHAETIAQGTGIRELPRLRRVYGPGNWRKRKGTARIQLDNGDIRLAELQLVRSPRHRSPRDETQTLPGLTMSTRTAASPEYVVCVENADYPVSLELHKIYRALPDEDALADGDLRVVDESGEDYLFPATAFAPISPPERVRSSLRRTAAS